MILEAHDLTLHKDGSCFASGRCQAVLTRPNLRTLYDASIVAINGDGHVLRFLSW